MAYRRTASGKLEYEAELEKLERTTDIGAKKTNQHYTTQISQGFEWRTNASLSDLEEYTASYESLGNEVLVGEKAFHRNGTEDPNMRSILTRPKKR